MKNIKIIKNRKRRQYISTDPKKESVIKELAQLAEGRGYSVKRENLKQGIGWKVMSGTCRLNDQKLIFVDRKLSQSDQITFLFTKCLSIGVRHDSEEVGQLSPDARKLFISSVE